MKTALTIAGSDSGGGAGIQADIKTMTMNGVYAMSAITALTAQNTTGVVAICDVSPDFLASQLDAIFQDIYPDAVKIGMVSSPELTKVISQKLRLYNARNIVIDPVMVSTSGSRLMKSETLECFQKELLPLANIITPNIAEAEVLSKIIISDAIGMQNAAKIISEKYGCAVLCKGGHSINDANDFLYESGGGVWFDSQRVNNPNTHGTGCTLSSAIAANLAKGFSLKDSIQKAKAYLTGCLEANLNLGSGSGPLMHNYNLTGYFSEEKE
ncbi:MAG: bifunctional hydroxymethylpyrimidine kinase/phosphomethylpyrimidine kinase [Clostridia bacterium]|nr:bifunctional hydroxymethylpyrimidine kinase/phosphomethylpyrimidine kinase [Clostridia bacterium]